MGSVAYFLGRGFHVFSELPDGAFVISGRWKGATAVHFIKGDLSFEALQSFKTI